MNVYVPYTMHEKYKNTSDMGISHIGIRPLNGAGKAENTDQPCR